MPKIIYFNSSCSHCEATITCLSRFFLRELLTAAQRFYESYCRVVQNNLLSMIVSLGSGIWITRWRWLWWSLSCALIWVEQSPSPIQPDWSRKRDYTKRRNMQFDTRGMYQQSSYGFFWNLQFSRPKSRSRGNRNVTLAECRASREVFARFNNSYIQFFSASS